MADEQCIVASSGSPPVEYRPVPGHPGYRVGDDGSVWTCLRRKGVHGGGTYFVEGHEWKPLNPFDRDGYLMVHLRSGVQWRWLVHQLVLTVFVGLGADGMQGLHFPDRDTRNNSLVNLRWGTPAENSADARSHGTARTTGERNARAKLTEDLVRSLRFDRDQLRVSFAALGRKYHVSEDTARKVCHRKIWAHVS